MNKLQAFNISLKIFFRMELPPFIDEGHAAKEDILFKAIRACNFVGFWPTMFHTCRGRIVGTLKKD